MNGEMRSQILFSKNVFVIIDIESFTFFFFHQMLRPEEVEMLVCGNPDFDMKALCKVTTYDGFSKRDVTIRCCITNLI